VAASSLATLRSALVPHLLRTSRAPRCGRLR
jgi:hypothetical protein